MWEPALVALVTRAIRAAAAAALIIGGLNALLLPPAEAAGKACTIVGTTGDDSLRGTDGDDVICALGGDDKVLGLGGDDVIRGGGGADVLRGGPGDDFVAGGRGGDRIFGQGGDDVARGDGGDDVITGGPGSDRLGGFRGADTLRGVDGNKSVDDLRCGPGPDTASGDPGDRVRADCEGVEQNDPPTDITLDPATIAENEFEGTDIGDLATNDPDVGDEISFTLVPGAGSGDNDQVEIDGDSLESAVEYDFETQNELTVRVRATDAAGEFVEEALVVAVTDENDAPVAVDDDATTTEDTTLDLPVSGAGSPAANDTDQDGDTLTVTAVSAPSNGTVNITAGQIHFTPAGNACGTGAGGFTYTVGDGNGGAGTGTVTVDITCVDDPPDANDDAATVGEDSVPTSIDVLANDVDPESNPISVTGVGSPSHGSAGFTADHVNYTPDANYCGTDAFTYTISGGDVANVAVTVTCVNDAPIAVDDAKSATEDTPLSFPASDLLTNDSDVDAGDTLTVTGVSASVGGTAQLVSGTITFTPSGNLCTPTPAGFDYAVSDGHGGTDTGTVTVTVSCVNDPPVANDDSRTVAEDSGETTFSTLLANDTDVENDTITITDASNPPNGSTTFNATSVSYTPDADYCGTDSFTYTVNGGDTATVTVNVTCVNDTPVVDLDSTTGGNGSTATFIETDPHVGDGVLIAPNADIADIDDPSIETMTVTLTNRPDGSSESITGPASLPGGISVSGSTGPGGQELVFTGPASKADFEAVLSGIRYDNTVNPPDLADRTITVVVNDGDASSVSRTATVQIDQLNASPVNTVPGPQSVIEDGSIAFTSGTSISVADADGGNLTVQVSVTHGTFTLSGTSGLTVSGNGTSSVTLSGSIAAINAGLNNSTYAPATDYAGPAQLTIDTSDGIDTDTDSVALTVTPVNDPPTATNLSAGETYTEDTSLDLIDIVVSDVDDSTTTVTLSLSSASAGTLTTATAGTTTSTFGSAVWTASGPIAEVNALLAGVSFVPAANYNGTFAITTSVDDGSAPPVTGAKTMTGIAVNDPPTSTAPATATVDEDTDLVFSGGLSVADVDGGSLTVIVNLTHGVFTLSGTAGLSVTGNGTASMTATGSIANLNTALNGAKFHGTANYNGAAELVFSVTDTVAPSVQKTVNITVTPVNDAPVADDETFNGTNSAIGNTTLVVDDPTDGAPSVGGIKKTITGDVLAGDVDVDGDTLGVVAGTITTGGGIVVIQADGDFTLLPPAGCASSYSFDYTVTDGGSPALTDTGTVTVAVTECVWYVDQAAAAGGDGRSQSPFQTLTPVNGVGDVDDNQDFIYVRSGTYTTGLTLEPSQSLFGESWLFVDGSQLGPGSGTNPTITNASGDALVLSTDNSVQGVSLGSTPAASASLKGTTVGTLNVGGFVSGTINNAAGSAIDISGGTVAMTFQNVSSSGATNDAIRLDNTAGTMTAVAGSLQNAGGQDVDISGNNTGDDVGFTYLGTITDDLGQLVNVSGQNGGTKTFGGAITDGNDGDGSGISLTGNTGATVRFDGGLTLSTGANSAFAATGGGTVVVTGSANTALTTTGTALNVTNTTIGTDDLTFRSIASNGATNGVVLNSTANASGSLVVTGSGGTCSSAANCSGGAIQSSTGPGVLLASVPGGASLTRVAVNGGGDDGIRATTVGDLDLVDSVVLNNGNSHTGGAEERGLDYLNVTGTPQIVRTTVSGSDDSNAHLQNTVAGTTALTVDGSTFSGSKFNAGMRIRGEGASTMTASVTGSTFSTNADPGFAMSTDASNTAHQTLLLDGNSLSGGSSNAVSGRPQVSINADSGSVVKATISNNQVKSAAGAEIIVNSLASQTVAGSLDAKVIGNTINDAQPGALDALADGGSSIWGWAHGDGATRIEVRNNEVANWGGRALELSHNDGTGTADFTVTGNTFSTPDVSPNTFEGMYILAGGASGDTSNVCVDLENNDLDGIGRQSVSDLAIDRFTGSTLRFADFNDTSVANLQTNLRGKNPASPALTVETFSFGPTATAATSCTLTTGTP